MTKIIRGGGVKPDVEVTNEKLSIYVQKVWASSQFYNFAIHYKAQKGIPDYLNISDEIIDEFKQYLISREFEFEFKEEKQLKTIKEILMDDDNLKDVALNIDSILNKYKEMKLGQYDENIDDIKRGLISEFSTLDGGLKRRIEVGLLDDPTIDKTKEVFQNQNEYLNTLGYK